MVRYPGIWNNLGNKLMCVCGDVSKQISEEERPSLDMSTILRALDLIKRKRQVDYQHYLSASKLNMV